ncbi:hypothetical protein BDV96DRAFT_676552 [Lophiotrema nucula]|uniref:Uncharacterized protein n=1 Tax=Lophiotrema nucula TaxID=690887 RepID=A0A6A5ZJ63_9PLEO|nr:hypothetical protein BDV96DRAFT_676552 [Lophiotrema nucula]
MPSDSYLSYLRIRGLTLKSTFLGEQLPGSNCALEDRCENGCRRSVSIFGSLAIHGRGLKMSFRDLCRLRSGRLFLFETVAWFRYLKRTSEVVWTYSAIYVKGCGGEQSRAVEAEEAAVCPRAHSSHVNPHSEKWVIYVQGSRDVPPMPVRYGAPELRVTSLIADDKSSHVFQCDALQHDRSPMVRVPSMDHNRSASKTCISGVRLVWTFRNQQTADEPKRTIAMSDCSK